MWCNKCMFSDKSSDKYTIQTSSYMFKAIEFLLDAILMYKYATQFIRRQLVYLWTPIALSDLFLYRFELHLMTQNPSKERIQLMSLTFIYIDDVTAINNLEFQNFIKEYIEMNYVNCGSCLMFTNILFIHTFL